MKISFFILLNIVVRTLYGQFGHINDPDGYTLIRNSAATGNNVTDTAFQTDIFYCFPSQGNWTPIDYSKNNNYKSGFIYNSKIRLVTSYSKIKKLSLENKVLILKSDSIKITIACDNFKPKINSLKYNYNDGYKFLWKINNKLFYGTDGEVPHYQYKSITIQIGKIQVKIPEKEINDLYEPNLNSTFATYDQKSKKLFVYASNSDGAGSYEVIWVIENGIYQKRCIAFGF